MRPHLPAGGWVVVASLLLAAPGGGRPAIVDATVAAGGRISPSATGMRAAVSVASGNSVTWQGYTISAAWVGPTTLPTGLPATIQVTVRDGNQPDASWAFGGTPTAPGALLAWNPLHQDLPNAAGQLPATITAWNRGTFRPRITLALGAGRDCTITLPQITFTGSSVAALPGDPQGPAVSPWWIDQAWQAWPLIAAVPRPPTIALVTNGYPATAAINGWLTANGMPPLTVAVAPGFTLANSVSAAGNRELMVDLLALGVSAPGARVILYPFTTRFSHALQTALATPAADVLSVSYVVPSDQWTPSQCKAMAARWTADVAAANRAGMTVVAAAGDQGPYTTIAGTVPASPTTSLLAALSNVTAVGGVAWRATPSGSDFASAYWGATSYAGLAPGTLSTWVAAAQGEGNLLGGGGYSQTVPEPSWQIPLLGKRAGRGVPDLSGPASANYPAWTPTVGTMAVTAGGTSLATPLVAGWIADMAAVAGHGLGNINPALYALQAKQPSLFAQPIEGNNGWAEVVPGAPWNPLTGLGAPRVARLASALLGQTFPIPPTPKVVVDVHRAQGHWLVCANAAVGSLPLANLPAQLTVTPPTPLNLTWDPMASPGLPAVPGAAATNDAGTVCWAIAVPDGSQVRVSVAGTLSPPYRLRRPYPL